MYKHDPVISASPWQLIDGSGLFLGLSTTGRRVTLDPEALERHLLVLGKTGTGKSSILRQILKDILENNRGSAVIFDPHGSLSKSISTYFPDRTIVISQKKVDAEGTTRAISLNSIDLESTTENAHLAAGWVKDAFSNEGVLSHGTWGPRLEVVFSSILLELMNEHEHTNLNDLLELLIDPSKMRHFVASTKNTQLKSFLKMQLSDWKNWNQYIGSSINKLLPLMNNQGMRDLISGRTDSIDISKILSSKSTLLIPEIWKDEVPEDTFQILTVLLLLKIWLQRVNNFDKNRDLPIYLVFDEAQLVPARILDRILREGRKFGLRVLMATQFLGSGSASLSETILGNVSNVISFSLLEKDSYQLSSNFFSGKMMDKLVGVLKSQAIHKSVIWIQNEEGIAGPLSFTPARNYAEIDEPLFRKIRENSILQYGSAIENNEEFSETELHEFLILEFQKMLEKKSISFDRNLSVDGLYPDLFFNYRGVTFFMEVEVSDLVNFRRIRDKIINYSGRKLIFVTPPGASRDLFGKILDVFLKQEDEIHLELRKKPSDPLSSISILEYDNGYQFLAGGKLRQLRLEHLFTGSYMRTFQESTYPEIRSAIYSQMVSGKRFSMKFPAEKISCTFGDANCSKARKYLIGDLDYITIKDLFRVRAYDTQTE